MNPGNEMLRALHCLTNHVIPKRWEEVRVPNELELKQTHVLALPLNEVSAKVRTGPPLDDKEDYALPVWAGVIPIHMHFGEAQPDSRIKADAPAIGVDRFAHR